MCCGGLYQRATSSLIEVTEVPKKAAYEEDTVLCHFIIAIMAVTRYLRVPVTNTYECVDALYKKVGSINHLPTGTLFCAP
jgi:hypothetical protein